MNVSKKSFLRFFNLSFPFLVIAFLVSIFFYKVFLGEVPVPGDFVVGVYHPWIDHKWPGFPSGVPVKNPILADVVSFTFPMQTLAIKMMKGGQLPLWNPYILGGAPLLANFQSAPFAITNIVYLFSDSLTGWSLRIILEHMLAALFTYLLLRHWKVGKIGSISGGMFFAFGGFNTIWSQWNAHVLTASFIPLILLLEDKFINTSKTKYGVYLSVVMFLQLLSGYPQVVLYTYGAFGLLWIVNIKRTKDFLLKTIILSVFALLGIMLSAFQWLPAKELLSLSQRSVEPHPFEWAFLPWKKIITFIAPDYYGNHATGNWWGPQDYTSNTGYVGLITLFFSFVAVLTKNKNRLFLILLSLGALLLSFPTPISIFLWRSGILGLQAASAHRAMVLFDLGIAVLSGFGIDFVLKNKRTHLVVPFSLIFILLLTFTGFTLLPDFHAHMSIALKNLVIPFFLLGSCFFLLLLSRVFNSKKKYFVIILITLGIFELFRFGWKFNPFTKRELVFPVTPVITYLQNKGDLFRTTGDHVIPINMRMNYGIESLEGYDAVYPESISKFLTVLNHGSPDLPLGRYGFVNDDVSPLLSLSNVSYVLALNDSKEPLNRFNKLRYEQINVNEPKVVLFKDKNALPRSVFFYDWQEVNDDEAIKTLSSDKFIFNKTLLIDRNPNIEKGMKGESTVTYIKNLETESVLNVTTSVDGLLFTSDTFYPGWKAYIDGKEVPIIKADYTFRAVAVPKGTHVIKYLYKPDSFGLGLKLSALAAVILLLMSAIPLLKRGFKQYN